MHKINYLLFYFNLFYTYNIMVKLKNGLAAIFSFSLALPRIGFSLALLRLKETFREL